MTPAQFEAALLNLAANARDAMNGSGFLTIVADNAIIGASDDAELAPGEYVAIAVSDTGCGMSKDVLARAFEPFYTTKEVGKGTGLGLAQVYGFSKQAGGTTRIESTTGKGTTVRMYLPRAEGEIGKERSFKDLSRELGGSATVLIVEDHSDVREMITGVLSQLGYCVLAATTGPEALATLRRENSVQALVSDVVLPGGMSGLELARNARKLNPDLKVLLTSGYVAAETKSELLRGEFSFLAKPYRPAEFAAKLALVLATP